MCARVCVFVYARERVPKESAYVLTSKLVYLSSDLFNKDILPCADTGGDLHFYKRLFKVYMFGVDLGWIKLSVKVWGRYIFMIKVSGLEINHVHGGFCKHQTMGFFLWLGQPFFFQMAKIISTLFHCLFSSYMCKFVQNTYTQSRSLQKV